MIPFKNRLKGKKEIRKVLKEGKGFKEDFIFLKKIENGLKESRFCIIVSQAISKKSSVRNKLKRRLREILRENLLEIKKGFDILLIALPGLEEKKFHQLRDILRRIFLKADILK